jgi:hypothetical protein
VRAVYQERKDQRAAHRGSRGRWERQPNSSGGWRAPASKSGEMGSPEGGKVAARSVVNEGCGGKVATEWAMVAGWRLLSDEGMGQGWGLTLCVAR